VIEITKIIHVDEENSSQDQLAVSEELIPPPAVIIYPDDLLSLQRGQSITSAGSQQVPSSPVATAGAASRPASITTTSEPQVLGAQTTPIWQQTFWRWGWLPLIIFSLTMLFIFVKIIREHD